MAESIIWSQESLDDIDSIAEYISRDSIYYAQQVVEQIFTAGESLLDNPMAGRKVPELGLEVIRERFIFSYRLIYEVNSDEINILAIIHGKRLLESVDNRF